MRKLTVGLCVYDDFDGLYFTLQAIRMYHREVINDIEFVIINNNPLSKSGKAVKEFIFKAIKEPFQYLEFTKYTSTSIKNKVFELSDTPYTLCMDCHVLLQPGSLKKLIDYYDSGADNGNLLHGPLIQDGISDVKTSMTRDWGSGLQGKWHKDEQYIDENSEPFEIEAQGMGLFSCRTKDWLGYNKLFRGFGGEEIYIHDKFRKHGKKVMCLPFLGWMHRFVRVDGVPYPNKYTDRYRNYLIGRFELRQDIIDVEAEYSEYLDEKSRIKIRDEVLDTMEMELPLGRRGCGCKK